MPPIIRTILDDIPPEALGLCLPHEHLYGWPPPPFATEDLTLNNEEAAIRELERFRAAGGSALVEMTTPDYNRDAAALERIARASGVHIIAATGYNKEKFSAPFLQESTVEELAARFVTEVTQGMDGTSCRAGLIKASSTLNEISPLAEKLFRAAAQAHHATGAPISTHTEKGTMALEQVTLLTGEGVDPSHIIIGHIDLRLEWDFVLALARTGVYFGFDQVSKAQYAPDSRRVEFVARLVAEGHGGQLLLSGDLARRSYWHSYGLGGAGFTYIPQVFAPLLRQAGLTEEAVHGLLAENPARALAFTPRL